MYAHRCRFLARRTGTSVACRLAMARRWNSSSSTAEGESEADRKARLRRESGVRVSGRSQEEIRMADARKKFRAGLSGDPDFHGSDEQINKQGAIFTSIAMLSLGCTILAVPLYKLYCSSAPQVAGSGASTKAQYASTVFSDDGSKTSTSNLIQVIFRGSCGTKNDPVLFVPLQTSLDCLIGEPTLAFFSVYNQTKKTLVGLSTYNISPPEAAPYFNKIQCFCFEEQRIKPHELIEMPVFFFVDKEYLDDPATALINNILLNYTLFVM
eukprot:TRINITY_DN31692_c0_g1_i1.p1 TRINITY_DN31692_c0_g1~~TRINITY_DN31692_c0_g1_i1.p1  ORF type:complete len:268 (+),score=33.30 TRINITY_DN31692_c0_g1_i1:80-883(+)